MFTQGRVTGLRRHGPWRRALAAWAGFACLVAGFAVDAGRPGELSVRSADARHDEDGWYIDARFDIALSSGAREALENGVPLVFELQAQLVRKHVWLWDSVVVEVKQLRQLQYHALSRSYLVRDVATGTQGIYSRIGDALAATGQIEDLLLTDEVLDDDGDYVVRLRGSHDIESLPTPVRLLAYVSSGWDMRSEWHTWTLNR